MAIMVSRLQRAVSLAKVFSTASSAFSTRVSSPALIENIAGSALFNRFSVLPFRFQGSRFFSNLDFGSLDESNSFTTITPDGKKRSTLFEGTDYNHWLVTMEFPDPQPTKEEKVAAFEKTLAKVVGRTTWSYLGAARFIRADPKTKTYGGTGDRYNMGVLTPDPNAHTYNRPTGRYNDRANRRRDSLPLERNRNAPGYSSYGRGEDYSPPPRQDYGRGPMPTGPVGDTGPTHGQQENVAQGRDPAQGNN